MSDSTLSLLLPKGRVKGSKPFGGYIFLIVLRNLIAILKFTALQIFSSKMADFRISQSDCPAASGHKVTSSSDHTLTKLMPPTFFPGRQSPYVSHREYLLLCSHD